MKVVVPTISSVELLPEFKLQMNLLIDYISTIDCEDDIFRILQEIFILRKKIKHIERLNEAKLVIQIEIKNIIIKSEDGRRDL